MPLPRRSLHALAAGSLRGGSIYADSDGLPRFRAAARRRSAAPHERAVGVACDNLSCAHFNEDVAHLPDLVEPGPACWRVGHHIVFQGVPSTVAAIAPDTHSPHEDLRLATPNGNEMVYRAYADE